MHSDDLLRKLAEVSGKHWVCWEDVQENYDKKYRKNTKQNGRKKWNIYTYVEFFYLIDIEIMARCVNASIGV